MLPIGTILEWLIEQKGIIAFVLALVLFIIALVLRFGYERWWPEGIVLATVFGLIAVVNSRT